MPSLKLAQREKKSHGFGATLFFKRLGPGVQERQPPQAQRVQPFEHSLPMLHRPPAGGGARGDAVEGWLPAQPHQPVEILLEGLRAPVEKSLPGGGAPARVKLCVQLQEPREDALVAHSRPKHTLQHRGVLALHRR